MSAIHEENLDQPQVPLVPVPLWRNRDYLLLLSGQAISQTGTQVSQCAAPLLILLLTKSSTLAGGIFGLVLVPNLILSLLAGALIDRWNRNRVMIVCDTMRFFALASVPVALLLGGSLWLQVAVVGMATLIDGIGSVFFSLSELASYPRVVGEDQLDQAYSQQETTINAAYMAGPALAGLFLSLGRAFPFVIDALSYAVSVVSLLLVKTEFQGQRAAAPRRSLLTDIREGARWLWNAPLIRFLTLLAGVGNGIDNAVYIVFIVIATRDLHAPAWATGLTFGVVGAGGILGAALSAKLKQRVGFGPLLLVMQWSTAALLASLLVVPSLVVRFPLFWIAPVVRLPLPPWVIVPNIIFLTGLTFVLVFVSTAQGVAQKSYRQALIPDELQGRVNSIFRLISYSVPILFVWSVGTLLDWIGSMGTVLILVVIALMMALLTSLNPARCVVSTKNE